MDKAQAGAWGQSPKASRPNRLFASNNALVLAYDAEYALCLEIRGSNLCDASVSLCGLNAGIAYSHKSEIAFALRLADLLGGYI